MYNDMKRVLAMIERINDIVMASQAVLVMPVDPMSLDPRTLAYLRRSAEVIG
jgi:archaellum biogenesis ATPase FlaH